MWRHRPLHVRDSQVNLCARESDTNCCVSHRHIRHDTTRHTPGPTPALTITLPSSEHPNHTAARAQGPPLLETHPWARGLGVAGGASERAYEHWAHPTVARAQTNTHVTRPQDEGVLERPGRGSPGRRDPMGRIHTRHLGSPRRTPRSSWCVHICQNVHTRMPLCIIPSSHLLHACLHCKSMTNPVP